MFASRVSPARAGAPASTRARQQGSTSPHWSARQTQPPSPSSRTAVRTASGSGARDEVPSGFSYRDPGSRGPGSGIEPGSRIPDPDNRQCRNGVVRDGGLNAASGVAGAIAAAGRPARSSAPRPSCRPCRCPACRVRSWDVGEVFLVVTRQQIVFIPARGRRAPSLSRRRSAGPFRAA